MSDFPPDRDDDRGDLPGEPEPAGRPEVPGRDEVGPPGEPAMPDLGPPGPEGAEEGFIETCVSVITSPAPTLRRLTATQPVGWAIAVIVAAGVASGVANAAAPDPFGLGEQGPGDLGAFWVVVSPIGSLVFTAIGAAIILLFSKMLDGEATYRALFVGLGFASLPSVFDVLGGLAGIGGGGGGQTIASLITLVTGIWGFLLAVIAVREANRFSTGRAAGTIILAVVAPILVIGILAVLIGVLVMNAMR